MSNVNDSKVYQTTKNRLMSLAEAEYAQFPKHLWYHPYDSTMDAWEMEHRTTRCDL